MQKTVLDELISSDNLIKKLKLTSYINTSNMHVFDENCIIRKVSCPEEIIYRFYKVRKAHFIKRKNWIIEKLNSDYSLLESKIRFIKLVITEQLIIFNKKKDFIIKQINKFDLIKPFVKINGCWDYLLDLKIHFLTEEKIIELETKMEKMSAELKIIIATSISDMWNNELLNLDF